MIVEAIALAALAASATSDLDRKRAAAAAVLGQWPEVLKRLGVTGYLEMMHRMPVGSARSDAAHALTAVYQRAAWSKWHDGGFKEFEGVDQVLLGGTSDRPGAWVVCWMHVTSDDLNASEKELAEAGELEQAYLSAVQRAHGTDWREDVSVYTDDPDFTALTEESAYVLGRVAVYEDELAEHGGL
jgi:hypothetical protein